MKTCGYKSFQFFTLKKKALRLDEFPYQQNTQKFYKSNLSKKGIMSELGKGEDHTINSIV